MVIDRGHSDTDGKLSTSAPISSLAEHIVAKHHTFLRKELAAVEELFEKGRNSGLDDDLQLAATFIAGLKQDMIAHLDKEEDRLFSRLEKLEAGEVHEDLDSVLRELEEEHTRAGEALVKLQMPMSKALLPEEENEILDQLREKLHRIEHDLRAHMHIECAVLFPRIKKLLSEVKSR